MQNIHSLYQSVFQKSFLSKLNDSLQSITELFKRFNIRFVFLGGASLHAYKYNRMTMDIDVLIDSRDKDKLNNISIGYLREVSDGRMRKYILQSDKAEIDILYSGETAGDNLKYDTPDQIINTNSLLPFITLYDLIKYKINLGISYRHRLRDLSDVQELIRINRLPESYGNKYPDRINKKYLDLWSSIQNLDESLLIY